MNKIKKWVKGTLTVNDLVEYFYSIKIGIDMSFKKKQQPKYYAKNSRIYKV